MFKKKLNLSALATNKPIEQEEIKQIEKQENTNENNSLVNFNYAETIVEKVEETETDIKEEVMKEIIENDEKNEIVKYNYAETIVEKIENENEFENEEKIESTNEDNEKIEDEIKNTEDTNETKNKKSKKSKKVKYKYEENIVEQEPETEEEREKRYQELASKIEVNKDEFNYNKEEKFELFSNYKSDLDDEIKDATIEENENLKKNNLEDISTEKDENDDINKDNKKGKKEDKLKNSDTNKDKIEKKINKKLILGSFILLIITLSIISSSYLLKDFNKKVKNENIKTEDINSSLIENDLTNSGIINEEEKEEFINYVEEIQKDENLSEEEIKKKINDKIIEIYLKRAKQN